MYSRIVAVLSVVALTVTLMFNCSCAKNAGCCKTEASPCKCAKVEKVGCLERCGPACDCGLGEVCGCKDGWKWSEEKGCWWK